MLQVQRPQLCGRSAAAQVQAAHGRRQSQFADAQSSPGRQQEGITLPQQAREAWHQEIENQGEEDDLEEKK